MYSERYRDTIISIYKDGDIFVVPITLQTSIPLAWFLSAISFCRGAWKSLGLAYNPITGKQCMEMVIYYSVPDNGLFEAKLNEIISEHFTLSPDKVEPVETSENPDVSPFTPGNNY